MRNIFSRILSKLSAVRFLMDVHRKGGKAGKPMLLLHPEYISVGKCVKIKRGFRIECYPRFYNWRYTPKLLIGDGVIIGHRFTGLVADSITIGKNTIFAGNITLITENHGINPETDIPYHAQELSTGPIEIGEGCWLGQNVSVLPNVKIGNKCIIATNAVVTTDIPDYCIAAGCPARVIKKYSFENHCWQRV